ncbi:MAG: cbb3-type cytochrome c oxidase subunit I, partial [Candidatus Eisenbacteria bacterium]|nr:cbb3-type cytochrome c oxidase subunit I [Candidatus Eisenbacteria bacterium]
MTPNTPHASTPIALSRVLLVLAAAGFALGGLEAVMIRAQLAHAGSSLIAAPVYHQILTLHGVSLVFLCALPALLGMALGLLPARVAGGRDAFPRVAAFGVWAWVAGACVLHVGLLLGGTSGAGMLGNASMTSLEWASRDTVYRGMFQFRANGVDWWATAMVFITLGASLVTLDVVATLLLRRSPGVKLGEFTPFTWNTL